MTEAENHVMRKRKTAWKTDAALCVMGVLCAVLSVNFAVSKITASTAPPIPGAEHLRIFAMPSGGRLPTKASDPTPARKEMEFDPVVTGTVRPSTAEATASAPARTAARSAEVAPPQPATLSSYSLQGVFNGKALLQGPSGYLLVSAGEAIPGVGRIQSIQNRGGSWIIQTPLGPLESGK
jgi:hypothetical protein